MAIRHALLGLIVERRSYGHELAARLEERLGSGYSVSPGTVYTSLDRLERSGYIEVARRVMSGKRVRVYYDSTPEGVTHYEEWLDAPLLREPLRGELFLKLVMAGAAHASRLREAFEHLELECLTEIARHASAQSLVGAAADPVPVDAALRLLVDSAVLDRLNAERAFIRRALDVLAWAEAHDAVPRTMLLQALPSSD